jgi:hypothetical protein
MEPTDADK